MILIRVLTITATILFGYATYRYGGIDAVVVYVAVWCVTVAAGRWISAEYRKQEARYERFRQEVDRKVHDAKRQ